MSRPLLLFVDASPTVGGATRVLLESLAAVDPSRADALVACAEGSPVGAAVRDAGHEAVTLDMPMLTLAGSAGERLRMAARYAAAARNLLALVRARRPALLHATGLASALLAAPAARLGGVPLVWHAHDILPRRAASVPPVRLAAAASRTVVCVSRASLDRLVELGVPAGRCVLVYDAVPAVRLRGPEAPEEPPAAGPTVLAAGILTPQKGQHVLVEAAAELVRRHPGLRVDVAGEVVFERDRPYRVRIEEEVRRLGLEGTVRLLGFRRDLPARIARATVVAHPATDEETLGLVPLEAMAAGRPVVASRVGGLPEVVEDGVSGILVPPGDARALADAIGRLLDDPALRARMGEAGRRIAAGRFGADRMCAELDRVLHAILGVHVLGGDGAGAATRRP